MSKIGITLPGMLTLLTGSTVYPQPRSYQPKTYEPSKHTDGAGAFDSMTNLAQLTTTHVGPGSFGPSCSVDQTITTTGTTTFVAPCTNNLTISAWGGGGGGYGQGGGGAAFASSVLAVTAGQTWTVYAGLGGAGFVAGYNSFICPTANSFCTVVKQAPGGTCVSGGTTGLGSSNFVCARGASLTPGDSGSSAGTVRNTGGNYAASGGSGGSAGADGNGKDAVTTTGGAGDNGSGGAGGTKGNPGVSNAKGGGGSGYCNGASRVGGLPGGGGCGSNGSDVVGGHGQITIHSMNDEHLIGQPGAVASAGTLSFV